MATTAKTVEELVLICNATFVAVNEKLLSGPLDREIVRQYSVFATALNLLVTYSAALNFSPSQIKTILPDIITQFNVLVQALKDLSQSSPKKEEISTSKAQGIKSLYDVAMFIQDAVEKIHSSSDDKKGGCDCQPTELRYQSTQKIIGGVESVGYLVIVGRGEDRHEYVGGMESAYKVKQDYIRLENLRADLPFGDGPLDMSTHEKYYQDVFLPTIANILKLNSFDQHVDRNLEESILKALLEQISAVPQFRALPEKTYFDEGMEYYQKFLEELRDYIRNRGQEISSITETLVTSPNKSPQEMFSLTKTLLHQINEADKRSIKKMIKKEFELYKNPSPTLIEEFIKDAQMLSDPEFQPLTRCQTKQKYQAIVQEIENILETSLNRNSNLKIAHVTPIINLKEVVKLPESARAQKIYELTKYLLDMNAALLPNHQKIERYYDSLTTKFQELSDLITAMIAPDNKSTCIRRTGLLITTLIRGHMLPIVLPERNDNAQIIELTTKLQSLYSSSLPVNEEAGAWYTSEEGLKKDVLHQLYRLCTPV
jgi:hypothetical protein